ncbi:unnamed protein product [Effrenium voratum]|uniref:Uncharacterized protein n=1 Tax=Effrenium voratum TaxID=2562239 RepID=A0AA36I219_9DINO|nr:unnamed protein product [Effrenium voratum]
MFWSWLAAWGASLAAGGDLCVAVELASRHDLQAIRQTWLDNETRVYFLRPRALPRWLPGLDLRVWGWAQQLPYSCEWLLKVPSSSYLHLENLRYRLRCLSTDPSLTYLGVAKVPLNETMTPMADENLGIVIRRSLLKKLPRMLSACATLPEVLSVAGQGEGVVLGTCLRLHDVEFSPWMERLSEAIYEDPGNGSGLSSHSFNRFLFTFDHEKLSRVKCLLLVSGLRPEEMEDIHYMRGRSERWFKGVACSSDGLAKPEEGRAVFDPKILPALQGCFLLRAFERWQRDWSDGQPLNEPQIASPTELAKEWQRPLKGRSPAFQRLGAGGHELCVFVVTTGFSEKHRADARAVFKTWANEQVAGVKVFMMKDRSWPDAELGEGDANILTLRGDVDLGYLYNPVRVFYLWIYLAEHHASDCQWFAKVDADTFVNLRALKQRLTRYFTAAESHYLGSVKSTLLTSGVRQYFAVNSIVFSGGLLKRARNWIRPCLDDIVSRRLGQGAEDMDLGACLELHGGVIVSSLGQVQEMPSLGMARVMGGEKLLNASGECTIFIHPVHAEDMEKVYADLQLLPSSSCDWPKAAPKPEVWSNYMTNTFQKHSDKHRCWNRRFTWQLCCNETWGAGGNDICWDDEHTWERCCNRPNPQIDMIDGAKVAVTTAAPITARRTTTTIATTTIPAPIDKMIHVKNEEKGTTPRALTANQPTTSGNPKCWSEAVEDCWVWPFSPDFCCAEPLPPRLPIQVGGLEGQRKGQARSSRCPGIEEELLACELSLDEIGALFELPSIGSGDKASGWHDYLGGYERLLLHLPLSANVLEFGVRMGPSLAMWSEYFPFGTSVGVDKDLGTFLQRGQPVLMAHGAFTRGNVYAVEANASDVSGREKLQRLGFGANFADVVVDDANHWFKDQIARFELYFPDVLRPGGVYIIEDVHMQEPFDHDGRRVRAYFANLTASVYVTPEILLGSHQIRTKRHASQDWRHKVESVTFLRDVVAIVKAADA